jgi:uncharacterized protein (TIGR00252 family)
MKLAAVKTHLLLRWQRLRVAVRLWALVRSQGLHQRVSLQFLNQPLKRQEIGLVGESLAARYLRQKGRRVLYRNHRAPHGGEVDIVARHGQVLTFVEVKTRTSTARGRPADAVGPEKQRLIQRGALDWLRRLGYPLIALRFDIVEVLLIQHELPELNVIEDAFSLPESSLVGRRK